MSLGKESHWLGTNGIDICGSTGEGGPFGLVGWFFLSKLSFSDSIFYSSTNFKQFFKRGDRLIKQSVMIHGLQISDEHFDLLFFGWPVGHLRYLVSPPGEECSK